MGIENYLPKFKFTEKEKQKENRPKRIEGMTDEEIEEEERKITALMQTPEVVEKAQSQHEKDVWNQIQKENKEKK